MSTVRRRRIRTSISLLAVGALISACFGGSDTPSSDGGPVRVAMTKSIPALGVWVAQEQGYFDKHKVTVETKEISTTVAAQVPSLLGKQYDIAQMTPSDMITAADGGIDVVAVSAGYVNQRGDDGVLVVARKGSGITSAKDLVGKRIAAPSINGNVNTATMYWLASAGVDVDSVKVVAAGVPNMPDLLETGQVDAVEGVIPYGGLMASQGVKIAEPVTALGDRVQMSFWGSHREWAENNREVIGRFKAALDDASAWMKEHPQDAVTLLMAKTGVDKKFEKFVKVPEFTTKLTPEDLEVWKKAMTEVRGFSTKKQMKDLVLGGGDNSAE